MPLFILSKNSSRTIWSKYVTMKPVKLLKMTIICYWNVLNFKIDREDINEIKLNVYDLGAFHHILSKASSKPGYNSYKFVQLCFPCSD